MIQNWDCHECGNCCADYWVPVSEEERKRIEAQGWEKEPEFKGKKLFTRYGKWWKKRYRLTHRDGDCCIFLDDKGLCKIHAKFGIEAKPFACRLYPYILNPVGNHFRLSLRFACPSAAGNLGRPLSEQTTELRAMAQEMETWDRKQGKKLEPGKPPALQGKQKVDWPDLFRFVNALLEMIKDRDDPLPRRMLKCLALMRYCRRATYEKVNGPRLDEFLKLIRVAIDAETPRDLERIAPPSWVGRILFRTSLAIYLRKDQGSRRGISKNGKIALMRAMSRMVKGHGPLPRLQIGLPESNLEDFEEPTGPLPPEAEEALERYYAIKVESLQFCGAINFRHTFWDGFETLALTLPMIMWAARGYKDRSRLEAIYKAITLIDENFGYNPLLARPRQKTAVRILSFRKELEALIAWYGR